MILRHLRYFCAVAEHGSLAAAANALRLAQPSLSRQIRDLEREAGVSLLERTRRGVRITPAGSALLIGARAVAARLEDALRRAHLANEGKLGTLRLGLGRAALQSSRAGRAVAAIREQLPDVELEVTEVGSFTHAEALLANEVDLAIGVWAEGQDRGIRREMLFDEPVECVMISASHPLATARMIRPAELRSERLLIIEPSIARGFSGLRDALRELHSGPIETLGTVDSLYNLVAAGRGWAPALKAVETNPPAGTAVIPLAGLNVPLIMAASWRSNDRSRLVANVIAVLRQASAEEPSRSSVSGGEPARRSTQAVIEVPRGLESRHLRAFTVTVAEGSVSRAAARLGLTQSGLSRQIRALEREIGIELFRRGPAGVEPNAAGLAFREDAVAILGIIDGAHAQALSAQRSVARPCRIGAVPNELTGDLVLGAIRGMSERFPEVGIEIIDVLTPLQVVALRNREIDIGIAGAYPGVVDDPAISAVQIGDDVVECALLATSHPLASRAWLTAADLADIPFLFIPRATYPWLFDAVMQAFDQIGLTPRIEGSFTGARTVWRLAADAMGWTVGSRYQRTNPPAGLVAIPIEGFRIPSGVQVLWRRDEGDSRVKALLDAFRNAGGASVERPLSASLTAKVTHPSVSVP